MSTLAAVRQMPDARPLAARGPVADSVHWGLPSCSPTTEAKPDATVAVVHTGVTMTCEVAKVLPWTRRLRGFAELDPVHQILAVSETRRTHSFSLASNGAA
jgi:hypothetical protein